MQPGIVPQPRQELDPERAVLRCDQRPDHAGQREAAVEGGQVLAADAPGLLPEQFDRQFALGPEHLHRTGRPGPARQLRLAEVKPPGEREEPGGLLGVVEQGPEDDPVVRPNRRRSVRATGSVLVKRAGAPDVLARAMDLGVIDGRDVIAVPDPAGGLGDEPGQGPGDEVAAPGAGLGESLQRLPAGGPFDREDRLGDGVLLDVQCHRSDPFSEATVSGPGEGQGEGTEQVLPDGPEPRSVRHGASPVAVPDGRVITP